MAKQPRNKSSRGRRPNPVGARPTKKARVEVTYENASSSSIPAAKAPKVAPTATTAPTPAAPTIVNPTVSVKGKEKAHDSRFTASTFIIVAGSYEKLLYGLEGSFSPSASSGGKAKLEPIFIFPAHLACVKAIAASPGGKWLATGSEDEFVKVWDLRRRKEVGSLSQHTGSITSLHFPTSSHLISTSEDGSLSLFRCSDWSLLKSLKGHSGKVNHVDVHPTGRVALTVGKDHSLRMWDLMRGRGAASLPLSQEAEMVKFSPKGTHFAVLFPRKIEIYSLTLKLLYTLITKSRFNTILFSLLPAEDDQEEEVEVLCVGMEKGFVEIYTVDVLPQEDESEDEEEDTGTSEKKEEAGGKGAIVQLVGVTTGHTNRIKSISALNFNYPISSSTSTPKSTVLLSTASSDGLINLYDLPSLFNSGPNEKGDKSIDPIGSYDTKGTRLTCVYMADGRRYQQVVDASNGQATIEGEDDAEEEDEDDQEEAEDGDMYEQGEDSGEEVEDGDELEVEFEDDEKEEEEEE